jgi:hypothetical protein
MMGIGYETRLSQILPENLEEKERARNEFTIALKQDPFVREDPQPDRRRVVMLLTSPAATAERGGISGSEKSSRQLYVQLSLRAPCSNTIQHGRQDKIGPLWASQSTFLQYCCCAGSVRSSGGLLTKKLS